MRSLHVPLAAAFVVAAVMSLVNVYAMRITTVSSGVSATVTTTDAAALTVTGTNGNFTNRIGQTANGVQWINFGMGNVGTARSLRARQNFTGATVYGDDFEMKGVFYVTNNDSTCHDAMVMVGGSAPAALLEINGRGTNGAGPQVLFWDRAAGQSANRIKLGTSGAGRSMVVDARWLPGLGDTAAQPFQLVVDANLSGTCP